MATTSTTSVPEVAELASRLRLAIARMARRLRQDALDAEGAPLSPTLTAALATIEVHGPLTPSELADRERVRRPSATRIVGALEDLGLVTRAGDPSDRRASLVSATAAGKELLRRLRTRKNAYLARRIRDLEATELAALESATAVLERLLEEDPA
jgi:DNA-binding MarR family transcriptional regulator